MISHIIFEENQQLKIAKIIEHTETQYHIEDEKGKRNKIKANQIWLESSLEIQTQWLTPSLGAITELKTDIEFLYEAVLSEYTQEPFHFSQLAKLYFDENVTIEKQLVLLEVLKTHPIYFYKQGKGQFKAANPKQLEQAKAGIAKKQAQIALHQNQITAFINLLTQEKIEEKNSDYFVEFNEFHSLSLTALLNDALSLEQDLTLLNAWHKALKITQLSAIDGLIHVGRITHPYQKQVQPFLENYFPEKTNHRDFKHIQTQLTAEFLGEWYQKITLIIDELPLAKAVAYSIDDSSTTEIDDAFSCRLLAESDYTTELLESYNAAKNRYIQEIESAENIKNTEATEIIRTLTKKIPQNIETISELKSKSNHEIYEIGIHIAAPSLGLNPNDIWDEVAKKRLSTVYMPGEKITMFPEELVPLFSLDEGKIMPTLSLYIYWNGEFAWIYKTVVEKIKIEKNLRFNDPILSTYSVELLENNSSNLVWNGLSSLWQLAKWCQNERDVHRGQLEMAQAPETIYYLKPKVEQLGFLAQNPWHKDNTTYDVKVWQRERGNVLDKIVAELMIFANSSWAQQLNQHNNRAKFLKKPIYYGIFRGQHMGKVKLSTFANPHENMGVEQYMWATSPLRRYVDLVNQWQLIALIQEQREVLSKEEVMVIIAQFESNYTAYQNLQNRMEDYWSLAYLLQNDAENTAIEAMVLKLGVVQIKDLNLRTSVLNMPQNHPETLNDWKRGDKIMVRLQHIDLMNARCELHYLSPT